VPFLRDGLRVEGVDASAFIPACSFQILAERAAAFATLRRFHAHLEPMLTRRRI
jgi:hypothetical protein